MGSEEYGMELVARGVLGKGGRRPSERSGVGQGRMEDGKSEGGDEVYPHSAVQQNTGWHRLKRRG